MKYKIQSLLRALAVAAAVFGFMACTDYFSAPTGEAGADLLSLTIGEGAAAVVFAAADLPEAVEGSDWDFSGFDLNEGMDSKTAVFLRESDVTNTRIRATVSPRAWTEWGIGSLISRPDTFYAVGMPATFSSDDYIYIKVSSEDGKNFHYYRFRAWVYSSVTHLAGLTIGGIKASVEPGSAEWDKADEGDISIRQAQGAGNATDAAINFETFDARATVKLAKAVGNAAPDFTGSASLQFGESTTMPFTDQEMLYAEVTAHNTIDKAYYKFRVSVGRLATIKTLVLEDPDDDDKNKEVVGKGAPNSAWSQARAGSVDTAKEDGGGTDSATYKISIELDDPDASYSFIKMPTVGVTLSSLGDPGTWDTSGNITFELGNALCIRVVSANTEAAMYYKIAVNLLAAEFTAQPMSDFYYYKNENEIVGRGNPVNEQINWYTYVGLVGDRKVNFDHANFTTGEHASTAVRPLSFTLDRGDLDTDYDYQWYEADSWYGGYGFDKDGNIAYALEDGTEKREADFTADTYHITGLDEKKNVSLHNGGNQFYRLPYLGSPITGETSKTYTPPINRRPFISGFTSASHYYWVVITHKTTGRTLTSKRAVIVSEWNPEIEHYIVNLNAYLDTTGNTEGLQDNPKNAAPFTVGNHGAVYEMGLKFPAKNPLRPTVDFAVQHYSTVTAQAMFFLADGREWIQNWTQGDFGFADKDKSELVLWYNLTNDNATRGLNGTGNQPSGSGLDEVPAYVIVKPAGTKAIDRMPPFTSTEDPWGRPLPQNTGDAQGWFTPYIELCELRFEGPARQ